MRSDAPRTWARIMEHNMLRVQWVSNLTGRWYDPNGREVSEAVARTYWEMSDSLAIGLDNNFSDPSAFVLTAYVPFDLLPARGKTDPPHIYLTMESYYRRRFMRAPRRYAAYTHFSQTRTAARAAHDQAVTHMRLTLKRNNAWWRRIYIPRRVWLFFVFIGVIQWLTNMTYLAVKLIERAM